MDDRDKPDHDKLTLSAARDPTLAQVALCEAAIACCRIAEPAAAWRLDHQALAGFHPLRALAVELGTALDLDCTRCTRLAATPPARGEVNAVERGEQL